VVCPTYTGWFSGEYFAIKGHVNDSQNAPYGVLGGKWTEQSTFTRNGETNIIFDVKAKRAYPTVVPDITGLADNHSLKLWGPCLAAIKKGNFGEASQLKAKIEEEQREIRKQRLADEEPYSPALFRFEIPNSDDKLGTTVQDPQQRIGTQENERGHWVYK
jgi:hypothetical protein